MEEKIRKVIKGILWLVFGGAAILGIFFIILDAFRDHALFQREVGAFSLVMNGVAGYILLGAAVFGALYLLERIWSKISPRK